MTSDNHLFQSEILNGCRSNCIINIFLAWIYEKLLNIQLDTICEVRTQFPCQFHRGSVWWVKRVGAMRLDRSFYSIYKFSQYHNANTSLDDQQIEWHVNSSAELCSSAGLQRISPGIFTILAWKNHDVSACNPPMSTKVESMRMVRIEWYEKLLGWE